MAVTTEKSVELANADALPPVMNDVGNDHGRLRVKRFTFTQGAAAGDATSVQKLVKLPAGKVTVYTNLGYINWSAFGASRVLDVGHAAYNDPDGAAVAAGAAAWDNDIDVSAAGGAQLGSDVTAGVGKIVEYNSRSGVTIQASVAGGTIPAGATIKGYVVYSMD